MTIICNLILIIPNNQKKRKENNKRLGAVSRRSFSNFFRSQTVFNHSLKKILEYIYIIRFQITRALELFPKGAGFIVRITFYSTSIFSLTLEGKISKETPQTVG